MTANLSEKMIQMATAHGIVPPESFENLVVGFGRGIGDPVLLRDTSSSLYREVVKEFPRDQALDILEKILEIDELFRLVVERARSAHKYVKHLNDLSGDESPRRMLALDESEDPEMSNSVRIAVRTYYKNLSNLNW
jgi:hypothetical protein